MNILKYFQFHTNCLLRKKLYWLYVVLMYFILAFVDRARIWIDNYDNYVDRCADHQTFICLTLIFVVSLIIYEDYFQIYEKFFSIYIQNPVAYFITMAITGILANIVPFILGQVAFFAFNAVQTGFVSWTLLIGNMLVVIMEIIALVLFGIGLYMLLKKAILVIFSFFIITIISSLLSSPYISIPLWASVTKNEAYYTFPAALWIGRGLVVSICLLFFSITIYRFIRKCNSD